jgi:hypothetical protein
MPREVFLYGWRPIWHRTRLYAKLARIPVHAPDLNGLLVLEDSFQLVDQLV